MTVTPEELIKRCDTLDAARSNLLTLWEELATYILPNKVDFISKKSHGTKRGTKIYDSTPVHAAQILAASLHGALTSSSAKWFDLRYRKDALNENSAAKQWLEECGEAIYQELANSNFDSEVGEAYLDITAFGAFALLQDVKEEQGWEGFNFRALHLADVLIAENADGKVDTIYRKIEMTARQAQQKFGDNCGEKVLAALEKNPDKKFPFIQAILPRQLETPAGLMARPEKRPFACYFVNKKDKKICKETGYYELPVYVPRWSKVTGEEYGYGPGAIALADIRTLNKARYMALNAWAKAIDPPLMAKKSGILGTGSINLRASSVTYVQDMANIAALPQGTNWNADQLNVQDVRASIRRIFYSDQLELQDGPNMTATEVQVRYELMQRLLGATLGRLQAEFLNPLVERCFYSMFRAGVLPPLPEVVQQEGGDLNIEYVGALARSQRIDEVTSIQRLLDSVMALAQIDPEVADTIDVDKAAKKISDRLGVPADVMRGEDEKRQLRQARQQQQAQTQQAMDNQMTLEQAGQAAEIGRLVDG